MFSVTVNNKPLPSAALTFSTVIWAESLSVIMPAPVSESGISALLATCRHTTFFSANPLARAVTTYSSFMTSSTAERVTRIKMPSMLTPSANAGMKTWVSISHTAGQFFCMRLSSR